MPLSNRSSDNLHLTEKVHHAFYNRRRLFHARQMTRICNRRKSAAGKQTSQFLSKLRWGRDIFRATQHQHRLLKPGHVAAKIGVAERAASTDVSLDRGLKQHVGIAAHIGGGALAKSLREPAFHGYGLKRLDTSALNRIDALLP